MAGVELEFCKSSASPPPSGSGHYGGESPLPSGPTTAQKRLRTESEGRSEVSCAHHIQEGESERSEEEDEGDERGESNEINWNDKKPSMGQNLMMPQHAGNQAQLSDLEEEEDEDEEMEAQRSNFTNQLHAQAQHKQNFGNLRHGKFTVNGHYQQPLQHHSSFTGGTSGLAYNYNKQGGNGRRVRSFLEQQFNFLSPPTSLPTSNNEPLYNNNNNNYKEATVKSILSNLPSHYHSQGVTKVGSRSSERSTERERLEGIESGADQRRTHQTNFLGGPQPSAEPPYHHFLRESSGTTSLSPHSTHSAHSSPIAPTSKETKELKPDLNSGGGGGLNMLSRSLGNALLNLASLGTLPAATFNGTSAGSTGSLPLNLSNGGSMATNLSHLSQLMQHQQFQPPHQTTHQQQRNSPSPPFANTNNFPQLILASGQIVQGIQGAQVLIPSPQGLLTQTVLTIPITQPLSPLHTTTPSSSPSGGLSPPKRTSTTRPPPPEQKELTNHNLHIPLISQKLIGLDRNLNIRSGLVGRRRRRSQSLNNGFQSGFSSASRDNESSPLISAALCNQQDQSISSHVPGHHGHNQGHVQHYPHGNLGPPPSKISPVPSHHSHSQGQDLDEEEEEEDDGGSDLLDRFSDNDEETLMDGINLDEIKEFAKAFKLRRLSLGLTQTQVGQALSVTEGPAYSQSAICSALAWQLTQTQSQTNRALPIHQQASMFEKLDITPKSAQKIKPVLEKWMKEAEDRYRSGNQNLNEFVGMEPSKKRKRRTSFTPQALEILNTHFERNTHPSGAEITTLAHQLGYEREVIRIWFCNKRQALKNTVRMMSKSGSPA